MMVFAARDGEEVSLVSSQQVLLHHHCLTLLSIHSSTRPFIQGLLATPPAAAAVPAVQLICKEVQEQEQHPVVSRVWMDGRVRLSAPATNFLRTSSYCTRHVAQSPTLLIYLLFAPPAFHTGVAMPAM